MFTLEQGAKLVELARHAIETLLFNRPLSLDAYRELGAKQGAYVTLRKDGELRGQMGTVGAKDPLYQAVLKAARDAAFHDRRFEAVKKEEIKDIEIDVVVVMKPRLLRVSMPEEYLKQINITTDGLLIKAGVYTAIWLPNPQMTYGWDAERLLRHLCISAGLTMDAWRDLSQDIYIFQCQIFSEKNGKIVELV